MKLTKEQIKILEPFEQHFNTAIRSKYARYPGASAVYTIHQIYSEATGTRTPFHASCSNCIFRLLVDCGTLYFKAKEELEKTKKPRKQKSK
jgi:hypothetical protein